MSAAVTHAETTARHRADWATALGPHLERLSWDRPQIEAHQTAALRGLVGHAQARSPWHRARLGAVDAATLQLDDLASLPTMTKADLMGAFDEVVTDDRLRLADAEDHLAGVQGDGYLLGDLHAVASGGSSGDRGVFVYGWEAWIDVHLGLVRRLIHDAVADGLSSLPEVGLVTARDATHMTTAVAATFASDAVVVHPLPVSLPLREIVAGLNAAQPGNLTVYASMLGVLVEEAERGRLRIVPRRIVTTSEPLLPEVRRRAEAVLGAPGANCWGTSEGGIVAVGCWQAGGMHLSEDLVIVEPVDAEGRPVAPGVTAAKVLLTNLFNPLLPLIRYELTDEVVVLDEPCPCGSAYRRVDDIAGRTDDLLVYAAATVHPHVVRSVLGHHPEIAEYQVRQTPAGIEVLLTTEVDGPAVAAELEVALAAAGLPGPEVTTRRVDRLPRHPRTGKLSRFVPLPEG